MLKFKYDETKKGKFLKFWELKKLEEFPKKSLNTNYFLYNYLKLTEDDYLVIDDIIKYNLENKNIVNGNGKYDFKSKDITIETKKLSCKSTLLENLDNCHFVNYHKNRSNLGSTGDNVTLTEEFIHFLGKVSILIDSNVTTTKQKKDLVSKKEERDDVEKIYSSFYFSKQIPFVSYKSLLSKKAICAGITSFQKPVLFTELTYAKELSEEPQEKVLLNLEKPALHLFFLDQKLYEYHTGGKTLYDKKHLEKNISDTSVLIDIAKKIFAEGMLKRYIQKNIYKKFSFILKTFHPETFTFLEDLAKVNVEQDFFNLVDVVRELNRAEFLKGNRVIKYAKNTVSEHMLILRELGVVQYKKSYFIDFKMVRRICGKVKINREMPAVDNFIIDSDMNLTLYRDKLTPYAYQILLATGEITSSEYVSTFKFNVSRVNFASFIGLGPKKYCMFLKYNSPNYYTDAIKSHISLYFSNSLVFHASTVLLIRSTSNENFFKAKFLLEKASLKFEVSETQKNTFFVYAKDEFVKISEFLHQNKLFVL